MLALIISLTMGLVDLSVLSVPPHIEKEWTVEEMKRLATEKANEHNLNVKRFLKVIECESNWDRFAVGDNGLSHGLAQFYYPTRDWKIATSSAYEPEIALTLMAKAWSKGDASRWSCYRLTASSDL